MEVAKILQVGTPTKRLHKHIFFFVVFVITIALLSFLALIKETTEVAWNDAVSGEGRIGREPFPVSVNPQNKTIIEHPEVETYFSEELAKTTKSTETEKVSILRKVVSKLALMDWYQSLAAGASRVLIIQPGERKEQIAMNFAKILKWDDEMEREFLASIISSDPVLFEGKFTPGTYIVARDAKPSDVIPLVLIRFEEDILSRYPEGVSDKVALFDALTIASLLEREAYDFEDMRYIAGIIWNRLFIDMNLQIDATLQYAKGTKSTKTWWPKPVPNDKYIDSPYNTYKNAGLPPTPIANPSADAVLAALNPRETDCLFYFHDRDGGFHCSVTYEGHVTLLKEYYGRGK